MFENIRHYARYAVNIVALLLALLTSPELGALVPAAWLPQIVAAAAVLNTLLSQLRRIAY